MTTISPRTRGTSEARGAALHIAGIYVLVGLALFPITDYIIAFLLGLPRALSLLEIVQDWVFVFVTGALVYVLAYRHSAAMYESMAADRNGAALFRLCFENAPAAVAMFDREMRYLAASKRWLTDYRLGDQNVIGRSHYEVFPEIPERWKEIHSRVLSGAAERNELDPFPRLDGTMDWVRWEVRPWHYPKGEIGGLIMFTEVITDRVRIDEALRESEEKYRNLVEQTYDWVWEVDENGTYTYASPRIRDLLGYEPEDVVGKGFWDLMPEGEAAKIKPTFERCAVNREPLALLSNTLLHKDGHLVYVETSGVPIFDSLGFFRGYRGTDRDVTERRLAEEERKRQLDRERRIQMEAEQAKRQFYSTTIASVTSGKLNLVSYGDIEERLTHETLDITISSGEHLSAVRAAVARVSEGVGMSESRVATFVVAVGEAATNAVKHANGGIARVGVVDDVVQVCIQDNGPGMDALVLPKAILMMGFSTKRSLGLGYSLILDSVDRVYLATEYQGTWVLLEKAAAEVSGEVDIDQLVEALPDNW